MLGAIRDVARNISKAFERIWQTSLLNSIKSSGTPDQVFNFISSFLSSRWLREALDGKPLLECTSGGVPLGSIHVTTFSCDTLMIFCTMLPVTIPSILMIKFCTQNVTRLLIFGSSFSWLLIWAWVERSFLVLVLGKINVFHLIVPVILLLVM